jgi:hypothetical protein
MGNTMDMYEMEIAAETRIAQDREAADIRRLLHAARADEDGSVRTGAWWRRWLHPGGTRSSAPLAEAS